MSPKFPKRHWNRCILGLPFIVLILWIAEHYLPHRHIEECLRTDEISRLEEALSISRAQLRALKSQMQNAGEEHYLIIDTHLLMLADPTLVDGTKRLIEAESVNAEWALQRNAQSILKLFEHQEDVYFQERRADIGFRCRPTHAKFTRGRPA